MSLPSKLLFLFLVITLSFANATASNDDDPVAELLSLRSASTSGVIHLDDQSISRFLTSVSTPRPYSIFLFFDAVQFYHRSDLSLLKFLKEFNLVSSSFLKNNPNNTKIFFCDIEFQHSNLTFSLFGVQTLPHLRYVGPTNGFHDSEPMSETDPTHFAQSMSEFIELHTNISVGPIHRPPLLSHYHIILIAIILLSFTPYFIKKLLSRQTLFHSSKLWLAGSLFIYFFSVSGCMHNILNKAPMFLMNSNSNPVFFYRGIEMQLGAEVITVGLLYTVVGLLFAIMTHGAVKFSNVIVQRVIMIIGLLVSLYIVSEIVSFNNWKTGYNIHGYWPSGWN